jgi:hypothetical protein
MSPRRSNSCTSLITQCQGPAQGQRALRASKNKKRLIGELCLALRCIRLSGARIRSDHQPNSLLEIQQRQVQPAAPSQTQNQSTSCLLPPFPAALQPAGSLLLQKHWPWIPRNWCQSFSTHGKGQQGMLLRPSLLLQLRISQPFRSHQSSCFLI